MSENMSDDWSYWSDPVDGVPGVPPREPIETNPWKEFSKGVASGVDNTQGLGYGLLGAFGSSVGLDGLRDWGLQGAQEQHAEAAKNAAAVSRWEDIGGDGNNVTDFMNYAAHGVGGLIPTVATIIAGGGLSGLGMRLTAESLLSRGAAGLVGEALVAETAKRAAMVGLAKTAGNVAGGLGASMGLETGGIYTDVLEKTGEDRPGVAFAHGAAAGTLDYASTALMGIPLMKTLRGTALGGFAREQILKKALPHIMTAAAVEGGTEAVQTIIERAAVTWVDENQEIFTKEGKSEILNAGIIGGLGGGVFGGGGHLIGKLTSEGQNTPVPKEREELQGSQTDNLTDEDLHSPLPNELISRGKAIQQAAIDGGGIAPVVEDQNIHVPPSHTEAMPLEVAVEPSPIQPDTTMGDPSFLDPVSQPVTESIATQREKARADSRSMDGYGDVVTTTVSRMIRDEGGRVLSNRGAYYSSEAKATKAITARNDVSYLYTKGVEATPIEIEPGKWVIQLKDTRNQSQKIADTFRGIGVEEADVVNIIGKPLDAVTPDDLSLLRGVHSMVRSRLSSEEGSSGTKMLADAVQYVRQEQAKKPPEAAETKLEAPPPQPVKQENLPTTSQPEVVSVSGVEDAMDGDVPGVEPQEPTVQEETMVETASSQDQPSPFPAVQPEVVSVPASESQSLAVQESNKVVEPLPLDEPSPVAQTDTSVTPKPIETEVPLVAEEDTTQLDAFLESGKKVYPRQLRTLAIQRMTASPEGKAIIQTGDEGLIGDAYRDALNEISHEVSRLGDDKMAQVSESMTRELEIKHDFKRMFQGKVTSERTIDQTVPSLPIPESANEATNVAPAVGMAQDIAKNIKTSEPMGWRKLFALGDKSFGGTQADGKYTPKDAYDALELGVNLHIASDETFTPNVSSDEAIHTIKRLETLVDHLPTQSKRTEEQQQLQQFSTPHMHGFVAAWAANIGNNDVVLEPTAGTGNLVVHALQAKPAAVYANELSPRRSGLLEAIPGVTKVFRENANHLHSILPQEVNPSVVLMNPPFSADINRPGVKDLELGAKHVKEALDRLQPGGRLVAILGRGMAMDRPRTKKWWQEIQKKFNVRANIGISGTEYKKFGTTFDNQIVIIDKTGPTKETVLTGSVDKVEALIPLLEGIRNDRTRRDQGERAREQASVEPSRQEDPQKDWQGSAIRVPVRPEPPRLGTGGTRETVGSQRETSGDSAGGRDRDVPGQALGHVEVPVHPSDARGSGRDLGSERVGVGENGRRDHNQPDREQSPLHQEQQLHGVGISLEDSPDASIVAREEDAEVLGNATFANYKPHYTVAGSQPHPGPLVESSAMSSVAPPPLTYTPNLPRHTITTGRLSEVQLEAIAYAGQAHETLLPNGERRGFFIGDGTGVGKGAQIAGIILDNIRQGRKKAIWVSKNPSLINDAKRDMAWVGMDPAKDIFLLNNEKGEITRDSGVAFLGYDMLKGEMGIKKDATGRVIAEGESRVDQIVKWVGDDFEGVVAFDEAHFMGNALEMKDARGKSKPSARAMAGSELQQRLPKARVIYVSATGATEVANLAYADRIGLWGEGTAFPDKRTFINEMQSGGLAAMEVVAKDLKAAGSYVARSLSFEGVTYRELLHKTSDSQRKMYDTISRAWQKVYTNIGEALQITGGKNDSEAKRTAIGQFWGTQQRFFNQLLTSMHMPSVLDDIQKQLEAGNSAVLQLVNTNEATAKRRMAQASEAETPLEEVDISPRDIMMNFVQNSFPVSKYEKFTDEDGNTGSRKVKDSHGNAVEDPEAVAMRDGLLEELAFLPVPNGALELLFDRFGSQHVAEITGRSSRLVRQEDGSVVKEKISKGSSQKDSVAFQAGKKRILVFSGAGGTGFSFHADLKATNQQRRIHYLVQPGWRADEAVQGLGRTHRTSQKQPPEYVLPTTDLKAQRRFLSSIARRLDQLGALTKGQRDTGSQGMFSAEQNLENEYAAAAIQTLITDVRKGNVEGLSRSTLEDEMGLNLEKTSQGFSVPQFLNRLLSLTPDTMDKVFDAFYARVVANVEYARQQGTLDAGMETITAEKIEKREENPIPITTGGSANYVKIALTNPTKPIQFEHLPRETGEEWMQNQRTGDINLFLPATSATSAEGVVTQRVRKWGVMGHTLVNKEDVGQTHTAVALADDKLEEKWQEQLDQAPKTTTRTLHMITGTLLPIWDRLPRDRGRIYRTKTDAGEVLLGREIKPKDVDATLKKLGVGRDLPALTPEEMVDVVFKKGDTLLLANGWKIERRRVSGENRVEIVGFEAANREQLKEMGVFIETINYRPRGFIPTERAGEILERITKSKPITDVVSHFDEDVRFSMSQSPGPVRSMSVPAVERNVRQFVKDYAAGIERHGITVEVLDRFEGEKGIKARGAFHPKTRKIVLNASLLSSPKEVRDVLVHEILAHHGLNTLSHEDKSAFLQRIIDAEHKADLAPTWREVREAYQERTPMEQAEEVFARVAEDHAENPPPLFQRILDSLMHFLRKSGLVHDSMTASEVRRYSRLVAENIRQGKPQKSFPQSDHAQLSIAPLWEPNKAGKVGPVREMLEKFSFSNQRGNLLGLLGRRQLVDIYGKLFPNRGMAVYSRAVASMDAEANKRAQESDEVVQRWLQLKEEDKSLLADVMHASTIAEVDPRFPPSEVNIKEAADAVNDARKDKGDQRARKIGIAKKRLATVKQRVEDGKKITPMWEQLSSEAKAIYKSVLETYSKTSKDFFDALEEQIKDSDTSERAKRLTMTRIRAEFNKMKKSGPYFPLFRFGDFTVLASKNGTLFFEKFETSQQRDRAVLEMKKEGFRIIKTGKDLGLNDLGATPPPAFVRDTIAFIERGIRKEEMDENMKTKMEMLKDGIWQTYLQTLPGRSMQKHFIHRKKTPGYSSDAIRGFARNQFHASKQIARMRHGFRMEKALDGMVESYTGKKQVMAQTWDPKRGKHVSTLRTIKLPPEERVQQKDMDVAADVIREMQKRHELVMNPPGHPMTNFLSSLNFVWYLGLSPASAMVNMTQTPLVALPILGGKYGYGDANRELFRASRDWMKGTFDLKNGGFSMTRNSTLTPDEASAIRQMVEEGVIDLTQSHDLAGIGDDSGQAKHRFGWQRAMKIISWGFHSAEVMNREVAFMASYRLARKSGMDHIDAVGEGRTLTLRSHFDYTANNRPRYMRGNVARVLTTFKQYSQNMIYTMARMTHQAMKGESEETKRIARSQLKGILLAHGIAAGTLGLPLVSFMLSVVTTMGNAFGDKDEPFDAEVEFRNWLADNFGVGVGEVLAKGLPRAILPTDLAGRVGLQNLIYREPNRELSGHAEFSYYAETLLGPTAGIVASFFDAAKLAQEGELYRAWEKATPKGVRDIFKGVRYADEGVRNLRGDTLVAEDDLSAAEMIVTMMGFTPAKVAEMYEGNNAIQNADAWIRRRRANLLQDYYDAWKRGDREDLNGAKKAIFSWNRKHRRLGIDAKGIRNSIRSRRRRDSRTLNGVFLPDSHKEIRDQGRFADH